MTQLWPEGFPIDVEASAGQPQALSWQGRWRQVQAVVEQWVIHDDWWQDEIWRHYFQVETSDALLCVLYHDLLAGGWRLERVFD